jgi:hypothetical protein
MFPQVTMKPPVRPVAPLRPVRGLAMVVVTALVVHGTADTVATTLSLRELHLAESRTANPAPVSAWGVEGLLYPAAVLVQIVTLLVTAAVFVVWLAAVRANAERLSPVRHRRHRAWVVFGWCVPVVQFWFPRQIVDDVWVTSRHGGQARGDDLHRARRPFLVWLWWVLSLITAAGVLRQGLGHLVVGLGLGGDLVVVRHVVRTDAFLLVPTLTAAGLACVIVLRITGFQEARGGAPRPGQAGHDAYGSAGATAPRWRNFPAHKAGLAPGTAGAPVSPPGAPPVGGGPFVGGDLSGGYGP